ncbi:MAG: hypothetical protein JNK04_03190, partial [Myxococcales bacterium]|nr:hypothetical protein [Myxococcales bacterium]
PQVACNDQGTVDLNEDFDRAATASTASFVVGGILAAAGLGAVIASVALDRDEDASTLAIQAGPGFVGLETRW